MASAKAQDPPTRLFAKRDDPQEAQKQIQARRCKLLSFRVCVSEADRAVCGLQRRGHYCSNKEERNRRAGDMDWVPSVPKAFPSSLRISRFDVFSSTFWILWEGFSPTRAKINTRKEEGIHFRHDDKSFSFSPQSNSYATSLTPFNISSSSSDDRLEFSEMRTC